MFGILDYDGREILYSATRLVFDKHGTSKASLCVYGEIGEYNKFELYDSYPAIIDRNGKILLENYSQVYDNFIVDNYHNVYSRDFEKIGNCCNWCRYKFKNHNKYLYNNILCMNNVNGGVDIYQTMDNNLNFIMSCDKFDDMFVIDNKNFFYKIFMKDKWFLYDSCFNKITDGFDDIILLRKDSYLFKFKTNEMFGIYSAYDRCIKTEFLYQHIKHMAKYLGLNTGIFKARIALKSNPVYIDECDNMIDTTKYNDLR